jgi:hypothetical protein
VRKSAKIAATAERGSTLTTPRPPPRSVPSRRRPGSSAVLRQPRREDGAACGSGRGRSRRPPPPPTTTSHKPGRPLVKQPRKMLTPSGRHFPHLLDLRDPGRSEHRCGSMRPETLYRSEQPVYRHRADSRGRCAKPHSSIARPFAGRHLSQALTQSRSRESELVRHGECIHLLAHDAPPPASNAAGSSFRRAPAPSPRRRVGALVTRSSAGRPAGASPW